jgi:hypothetical protein
MFTKIFKSDYIFQFIFILLIGIVLFIATLLSKSTINTYNSSPMLFLLNNIIGNNTFLIVTINYILLFVEAILLKRALSSNELIPKNSLLPAFIYIITINSILDFHIVHPILFANLFLILVLQIVLQIYNKPESYIDVFNLGVLISIGSLFYFPSVIFFTIILSSFLVYSLLKWREWIISIIGFSTTYIIFFSIAFLTDNLNNEIQKLKIFFQSINIQPIKLEFKLSLFFIIIGILFIITAFIIIGKLQERSIYFRKKIVVLLIFFILGIITFLFPSDLIINHIAFTLIPFCFFVSAYILQLKNKYISEIFYLIIIGISIYAII